ncbi:MAG: PAS domain S-box protein [Candidatus Sumerlaeia bacterium]
MNYSGNGKLQTESLKAIFEDWIDLIILVDPDTGAIIMANKSLSRILGYRKEDILDQHFSILFPRQNETSLEEIRESIQNSDCVFEFQQIQRADGSILPMDIAATILEVKGKQLILANLRDATEREKSSMALRKSENRYRKLAQSITDYIFTVHVENHFPLWTEHSPACIAVTGYSQTELENDPYLWIKMVHEDDRDKVRQFAEDILQQRQREAIEHRIIRKDGRIRWVSNTAVPHLNSKGKLVAYDGLIKDITERVLSEKKQKRLAKVVEQAEEGVIISDPACRIEYVNPAFESISGFSLEELSGKDMSVFLLNDNYEQWESRIFPKISAGEAWSGTIPAKSKDGLPFQMQINFSSISEPDGYITNFVAFCRDITQEINLQEQLRQAQKMEAIGTLAGGIAHDFNNILAAILGYSEILTDEVPEDSDACKYNKQIMRAGNRAKELVTQILTFSRKVDKELRPLSIKPILKEALKLLRASMPTTIDFHQNIPENCGTILADPTQIHQVIMNLCTNAYHAMKKDGGQLEVSLENIDFETDQKIQLELLEKGPYVHLRVSDTGCGMAPEVRERIFLPFFTTKAVGEGTGLGLSMVHGIVTGLGGAIQVESQLGEGTTFHIYIPRIKNENGSDATENEPIIRGKGEHILYVDDEDMLTALWKQRLTKLGYRVTTCTDGQSAISTFKADPDSFDIVITDQTMPRMTGSDMAIQILETRPDIPIILNTGYSDIISPDKAREIGIREFFLKPMSTRDLSLSIRILLDETMRRN